MGYRRHEIGGGTWEKENGIWGRWLLEVGVYNIGNGMWIWEIGGGGGI